MTPTPEAMQAARKYTGCDGCTWPGCDEETVSIAALLDSFAAAARADEREAIVAWICQNHFHEDDLITFIRQRGAK